ncbi:MAG: SocA family protein [SAR202 cluster bacterium]|nr:SocA family protein [SAR202 cluster bacterium]
MAIDFTEDKFKNLILYIAKKSKEDKRFGAIKLNKILYYADFDAYRRLGQSITGATYQRLDEGPAPRELVPVRERMIGESIEIKKAPIGRYTQQRIVALVEPDESLFGEAELRIVDQVLEAMWPMNGKQVTALSHTEPGWIEAETQCDIEYETAWMRNGEPEIPAEKGYWARWNARDFENYQKDLEKHEELSLDEVKSRYGL